MYHELKSMYQDSMPDLELTTFDNLDEFRSSKPPWLLAMNPNGKVPALCHGSICMFESTAICSYFLDRFDLSRRLLPTDDRAVSLYYLYAAWTASALDNLTATSSPIQRVLESGSSKFDEDSETSKRSLYEVAAPQLEAHLKESCGPFLVGREFTAVDVVVGFWLRGPIVKVSPPWLTPDTHPEICSYFHNVTSRPGYSAAVAPFTK
jgi:glutathione S-transferase